MIGIQHFENQLLEKSQYHRRSASEECKIIPIFRRQAFMGFKLTRHISAQIIRGNISLRVMDVEDNVVGNRKWKKKEEIQR